MAVGCGREAISGSICRCGYRQCGPLPPVRSSFLCCVKHSDSLFRYAVHNKNHSRSHCPSCIWHTCSYRKVTAAAERQLKRLWHTTNIYVYPPLHEYCEKLASHFPDPLKVLQSLYLGELDKDAGFNEHVSLSR